MSLRRLLALISSSLLENSEPDERAELEALVEGRHDELLEEKNREQINNIVSIGGEVVR